MFTKAQFDAFDPRERGFIVLMCGSLESQPLIPDEENPYPLASNDYQLWVKGRDQAIEKVNQLAIKMQTKGKMNRG